MFKGLLLTLAIAHGADTATSLYGFSRGAAEANPFIISTRPVPFLLQEGGLTTAQLWVFHRLHVRHPRLATVLIVVSLGVETAVTAHNVHALHVLHQTPR